MLTTQSAGARRIILSRRRSSTVTTATSSARRPFLVRRRQRWANLKGQKVRKGRKGQSGLLGRKNQNQDGAPRRAERPDHVEGLPRSRGRPLAECQLVQRHRQGSEDDPYWGGLVRRGLPDGRLRTLIA